MARAHGSYPWCRGFKSPSRYYEKMGNAEEDSISFFSIKVGAFDPDIMKSCCKQMSGLAEMYQEYIDGQKELREINMEFNARYVSGKEVPGREGCGMNVFFR